MNNLSLKNKIFYIFIFVIIISITIVGWVGFQSASKAYIDSAYELSHQSSNTLHLEMEEKLLPVTKDSLFITNFYALKHYMIWRSLSVTQKTEAWKHIFSDAMIDFLETKKIYHKIRIFDLDGNEIIVANYSKKNESANLLPKKELKNEKGSDYFEIPKSLKKEEFYISGIKLNMEHGKIEEPHTPVILYSTPIINRNNELVGVFVASVYADILLKAIKNKISTQKNKKISYYLVNENGDYIYHEDYNKMWSEQLKNGANFNSDYFNLKKYTKNKYNSVFTHNNKIYSFHKVHPLVQQDNENYFYIISAIDIDVALEKLQNFKIIFILVFIMVLLGSFFIVRLYVSKVIAPLSKVTDQLKALSNGIIKKESINYPANDEIGKIVKSTSKLIDAIEKTIDQANAVSQGDFSKEITLISKNNQLGHAISNMTKRLKDIVSLAQSISTGDYNVQIVARGSDDQLGLALINMVKYLEQITKVTESISRGELNITHKVKGDTDRLGYAILDMTSYLNEILEKANAITEEDFTYSIKPKSSDDKLGIALHTMTQMLQKNSIKIKEELWFSDGIGQLGDRLTGIDDTHELAQNIITTISRYVNCASGALYLYNVHEQELTLEASYALNRHTNIFKLSEGSVGQVAFDKKSIHLTNIEGDIKLKSATTAIKPKEIFVFPLIYDNQLFGVIELMSYDDFSQLQQDYLNKSSSIIATSLHSATQNTQIKELLEESQRRYEELQVQSEELQNSNIQLEEQQQQLTKQSTDLKNQNRSLELSKKELNNQAKKLKKTNQYKSEFLANMSHELRTPLNAIILLSNLLVKNSSEHLDEKENKMARVIHQSGNDLLSLINDILDLSKIESGNMSINLKDIPSADIATQMMNQFEELAKNNSVEFLIKDDWKKQIHTDDEKLSQILKNLLSNAFKFTKNGTVTLGFEMSELKNLPLHIYVEDSGIGIPKEKYEHIFEAFKQVDGSISREYGGTGLGLSISKRFAKLLGGEIKLSSKEGQGSCFSLYLPNNQQPNLETNPPIIPLTKIKEPEIIKRETHANIDNLLLDGYTILIADDDSRNIFSVSSVLQEYGAATLHALNGEEAVEISKNNRDIDVILMDIMMPKMDGYEAMAEIREVEYLKNIPIIAVTAKAMKEERQRCIDAGADDYLPKPINHRVLVNMIHAWINKRS